MNNKTSAKKASLFLLLISISLLSFSQKADISCCKLNLPQVWKNDRQLTNIIKEVLKKSITELSNSAFCSKGNATYIVNLVIDSVEAIDENNVIYKSSNGETYPKFSSSFIYTFYAALVVYDSNSNEVSRLRLLSKEDIYFYSASNVLNFQQRNQSLEQRREIIDSSGRRIVGYEWVERDNPAYKLGMQETYSTNPYIILSGQLLLSHCQKRIYDIMDILRKLN